MRNLACNSIDFFFRLGAYRTSLNLTPSLQPRYYTISSSSSVHPNRVHITVSVVDQPKPDGGVFRGVCSSFLQRLEPPMTDGDGKRMDESGDKRGAWPSCRIFVRASSFRLPADPKTPIVMVGPGTGIAPMRALLQERSYVEHIGEASAGDNVLYFGCKSKKGLLYREELEASKSVVSSQRHQPSVVKIRKSLVSI